MGKSAKIVFYSGTGGTAKVADNFKIMLSKKGYEIDMEQVPAKRRPDYKRPDLLLIIFPVHSFNAPKAIYEWIKKSPAAEGCPAVVISVSGGGEMISNTACRGSTIRLLEKKGYNIVYENMIVMPNNCIIKTAEPVAVMLLTVLPEKVSNMVKDIVSNTRHRTKPLFIDKIISSLGEAEKLFSPYFGKFIKVTGKCKACGWCGKNCHAENISMVANIPNFGWKCDICLKCIYGCPDKALIPGLFKFIVIKKGYSLESLEEKIPLTEPVNINETAKGFIWSGVRRYLAT